LKLESPTGVSFTDHEIGRLFVAIISTDVFVAARMLRERNSFTRADATSLNDTLFNVQDWCKNSFEVVNQLRISTEYSHHRYDVLLLLHRIPCVQIKPKSLGISPRRAMEHIVDYVNDVVNGHSITLLCILQLFIVSNRTDTCIFSITTHRLLP
jgi:type I restriction enzyme, R subunit